MKVHLYVGGDPFTGAETACGETVVMPNMIAFPGAMMCYKCAKIADKADKETR